MGYTEVTAKTVDEAITKACIELGLSSDQLDIDVVSTGSSGFLGIGAKPAVIRVRKKEEAPAPEPVKEVQKETQKEAPAEAPVQAASPAEEIPAEEEKEVSEPAEEAAAAPEEEPAAEQEPEKVQRTDEEIVMMKAAASKFLEGIFKAMELPVNITMDYQQEDDVLNVDFAGEDMGILIGKRGQTLDSLQYLTSLVVNRDLKNYVRIKLDTEDYRRRRKETLENLAGNIARKVKKTRRPVSLEPMNPYERRIIHSYLQNNRSVETYSEGNEPYRHVVVTLKKGER